MPGGFDGLRVLITNITLDWPSGTVVYARDLALELARRGHRPVLYTWHAGSVARELRDAGIAVTTDLWSIRERPDVIHGHHPALLRGALLRFPGVPAIAFCHDHTSDWDRTLVHPAIVRYVGVSELCVQRLLAEGAPPDRTSLMPNFVDLARLPVRTELPSRPNRALVFSNYASGATHLPAIEEACRRMGLSLDVIGRQSGRLEAHPEELLGRYDLVFAKAKAAMEAMAAGCAVILCDFGGVGPLVDSASFDDLRPRNFGFAALTDALTPENLIHQMQRYDASDARVVRDRVRTECGLPAAVDRLVDLYRAAGAAEIGPASSGRLAIVWYRLTSSLAAGYRRRFDGRKNLPRLLRPLHTVARRLARRSL